MTLSPLKQIESMPGLAGLSPQHKARLAKFRTPALLKYRWYPGIAFTIGFFSWMIIFGKGTDVLEDYPQWDLLRFLYSLGWIGYLAVGFLGYGIAIAFGFIAKHGVHAALLGRAIRNILQENRCLWCNYLLKGLEVKGNGVRCPECGENSPPRSSERTE